MMTSSILDADVKELCIHVMKKVIEKTQKDKTKVSAKMLFMRRHVLHQMELEPLTPEYYSKKPCFSGTFCKRAYQTR
jgi:hypothetical protein